MTPNRPPEEQAGGEDFLSALRALHLSAGRPSARSISRDLKQVASHTTIADLLSGRRIPSWAITRQVVSQLGGDDAKFQRLWEQASKKSSQVPSRIQQETSSVRPGGGSGRMKVFISWSGEQSLQVARALSDWLPQVLQAVSPYLSVEDTAKGTYWAGQIKRELDTSDFGIICLTPDNIAAPWINFEAGALSKSFDRGNISPFLFGLTQGDLTGPLTQFQVTEASKSVDVLRLVKQLDKASDRAVGERVAQAAFEMWWPVLKKTLDAVTAPPVIRQRPLDDMINEILNNQRALERFIRDGRGALYPDALVQKAANDPDLQTALEDTLRDLMEALDACAASDDPAINRVGSQAAAVRTVYEIVIGKRPPEVESATGSAA